MTVEEAVRERLLDTAAVTALVSTRIRMLMLRQDETMPAIRVQLISDPRTYHLRGVNGLERSRVQVDCYASTHASAQTIADVVDDTLSGIAPFDTDDSPASRHVTAAFRMNRQAMYEAEELRQFRVLLDYEVWSRPLI